MEKNWFFLQVYVNREKQVKEALENLLKDSNLEEYFGEIHIPTNKTFIIRDGKRIVKEKKYSQVTSSLKWKWLQKLKDLF